MISPFRAVRAVDIGSNNTILEHATYLELAFFCATEPAYSTKAAMISDSDWATPLAACFIYIFQGSKLNKVYVKSSPYMPDIAGLYAANNAESRFTPSVKQMMLERFTSTARPARAISNMM